MIDLTYIHRATPGDCGICGRAATMWLRSTARCGLTVAARACDEHEGAVNAALAAVTPGDIAASTPRYRRVARAEASRRKADRLCGLARGRLRASAALAGASSATHTHALVGGALEYEAAALYALAEALEASA